MHTHALGATPIAPILALLSPQKRCGESTNLQILAALVARALSCSNITPAAIFRTVERYGPTLILDEADTYLHPDHDDLRGLLNSGPTRATAYVIRTVGDDHAPRRFSTWCAKAIALIGTLPPTLAGLEDCPWPTLCHGKPITPHRLAQMLTPYSIVPINIRVGDKVPKGYTLEACRDAFTRYTPLNESATPLQRTTDAASGDFSKRYATGDVADPKRPKTCL